MPEAWSMGHPCVRSVSPVRTRENGINGVKKWEKGDNQNKKAHC